MEDGEESRDETKGKEEEEKEKGEEGKEGGKKGGEAVVFAKGGRWPHHVCRSFGG